MESLVLSGLFGEAYIGRKVLVTGHTGFKGSWLALWLSSLGARVSGLALAPDTAPSHWTLLDLPDIDDNRVDLRDAGAVQRTLGRLQPDIVFHLAAQPLVRRSYREPVATFDTNISGLLNLLEAIRTTSSIRVFVNATTDKVYLDHPRASGYREDDPLGGHDPYSTSKACAELVTESYRKSFFEPGNGVRVATARAGNVIGGGDWSEDRLVPDLVRAASAGVTLQIRNPQAIRPWQHVLEPLAGYLRLGQALLAGDPMEGAWNFGPAASAHLPVHALVTRLQEEWPGLRTEHIQGDKLREADALALDSTKAHANLGWRPVWDADATLSRTARWYRTFYEQGRLMSAADLRDYTDTARSSGLAWAA